MNVWVGMDVHRTRSQIAIVDAADVQQRNRRLANDPAELIPILGALAPGTPVAFEAAYGWGRKSSSSLMATSGGAVRSANAVTELRRASFIARDSLCGWRTGRGGRRDTPSGSRR
jgi:hypothetical protein